MYRRVSGQEENDGGGGKDVDGDEKPSSRRGGAAPPRGFRQTEMLSSWRLQALLMFNAYYSGIYFVMEAIVMSYKLRTYVVDTFQVVLMPLTFVIWSFAELFRLNFGYTGNLRERVPQLCAFFLVTIFPQLPCQFFLVNYQGVQLPWDTATSAIHLFFCISELVFSYLAIRRFSAKQGANFFRLLQEDEQIVARGGGGRNHHGLKTFGAASDKED